MALLNSGTKLFGLAKSRSPPFWAEPVSLEFFLASSSKLAPPLICAIRALASSSFSTRMWRARYSLPELAALNLSYSACASASLTGFLLRKSSIRPRISSIWRARSIWALKSALCGTPRASAACMKISRRTTSSLTWASSSGERCCWPLLVTCWIRVSTRALGTGLPLTVAMFCATAAAGSRAETVAATTAASANFFMGGVLRSG
mmetsp:Transcript_57661/g.135734  ORF Transcript_57661/g.135734 Transcript_57661/m.135734 type:complete len:205 (+) Transcript_57661:1284-1898(+)